MKQNSNPWPGLASYKDPKEYDKGESYLFCGRQNETYDLLQLIENRRVVTLYGSTGIGKTSLLCAGVFPILRQRTDFRSDSGHNSRFYPIYIRLNSPSQLQDDEIKNLSYSEILIKCLEKDLEVKETKVKASPYSPEKDVIYTIWHYFHSHCFYLKEGQERVTPVVVLDQFEEIFARSKNDEKIEIFLKQLYTLAEDRLLWKEINGYHTADYRYIISLREDKFFYMENYVDFLRLTLFKENRYRLLPLEDEQAELVITIPGEELIDHNKKKEIARLIIEQSKSKDRGDINTLLLSLICNQIYEKSSPNHQFTLDKVKELSPNVLKQFYTDVTKNLPLKERQAMENLLVKESRRVQVSEDEFLKKIPHGKYLLTQDEQSILRYYDNKVEVIHDQLAILMEEMKSVTHLEIYRERMKTGGWVALASLVLLVLACFTYMIPQIFWRDTVSLEGSISNTLFETKGIGRPYSIPSGVLNLANNVIVEHRAFQTNPDIHVLHLGDSCNIDYFAFQNCLNLTTIYFDGKGILLKDNAFSGCDNVESIIVSDSCSFSYLGSQDRFKRLSRIVVDGKNPNFRTFGNTLLIKQPSGNSPFWKIISSDKKTKMKRFRYGDGSSSLHMAGEVILPYMEDSIALDSMKAVYGTTFDISRGEIPDTNSYKVLTCINPTQGSFPKGVQHNSKVIGIDMPDVIHVSSRAFERNERLYSAYLPDVYDVGEDAFSYCVSLENVYLPKTSIIKDRAFSWCKSLKTIQLPLLEDMGALCFFNCDSLQTISAPSLKVINESAFAQSGLQKAEFPSVEVVKHGAFQNCHRLKTIVLPSLKSFDVDFYGCDSLEELIIPRTLESQVLYEIEQNYRSTPNRKFFELKERKGDLSILKSVLSPDTTYYANGDTLEFISDPSLYSRRLIISKNIRVLGSSGYRMFHKEVSVEHDNPTFFSFRNVVYDKDGIAFHAMGVEHAYFMNFGIGNGGKYSYQAKLSNDLNSIYLHYPQKTTVDVYVERCIPFKNGVSYQNDTLFLKTITLRVPYGYKKYFENVPDYQLFKNVEEVSRWETTLINFEWALTKKLWAYSGKVPFTAMIIIGIIFLLMSICGYIALFIQNRRLALGLFIGQIASMLFIGVLLYTIDLNYTLNWGNIDVIGSSLVTIEILLLFTPWLLLISRKSLQRSPKEWK